MLRLGSHRHAAPHEPFGLGQVRVLVNFNAGDLLAMDCEVPTRMLDDYRLLVQADYLSCVPDTRPCADQIGPNPSDPESHD